MKVGLVHTLITASILALVIWRSITTTYSEVGTCTMSYSYREIPTDIHVDTSSRLSKKYRTALYREEITERPYNGPESLGGIPVVFIPGNAGSRSQGRSLGSFSEYLSKERNSDIFFDWFMVDTNEELSALSGKLLLDQAEYVNDAISNILKLYRSSDEKTAPTSVIIVGHSMGGIVARTLVTLDNYVPGSVNTIYTLSTPHIMPPLAFDAEVFNVYKRINDFWRGSFSESPTEVENPLKDISLVSVSGGHTDFMVLPEYTPVHSILPETNGISAYSYSIPGVWRGIDHLAVMWCAELRQVIVESLFAIAKPYDTHRTVKIQDRIKLLNSFFKSPIDSIDDNTTIVWHGPNEQHGIPTPVGPVSLINKPSKLIQLTYKQLLFGTVLPLNDPFVNIAMPDQMSSLISLKVSARSQCELPVTIRHASSYESRWYEGNDARIFWYSQAPFVPFATNADSKLHVQVISQQACSDSPGTVSIKIDTFGTFANIAFRYRASVAVYTFAILVGVLMFELWNVKANTIKKTSPVGSFVIPVVTILGIFILLVTVSTSNLVRYWVDSLAMNQSNQYKSLVTFGDYQINDNLIGVTKDTFMAIIVPICLLVVSAALALVFERLVAVLVLLKNSAIGRMRNRPIPGEERVSFPIVSTLACIVVSIIIPHQVMFIILSLCAIFNTPNTSTWKFAVTTIFAWTSVVNAPLLVVWIRDISFHWVAVANLIVSGPTILFLYIINRFTFNHMALINLSIAILPVIVAYSLLFGAAHAFVLYNLVNYASIYFIGCAVLLYVLDSYGTKKSSQKSE